MVDIKILSEFEIPGTNPSAPKPPEGRYSRAVKKIKSFFARKFGNDSRVARLAAKLPDQITMPWKGGGANPLDSLTQIKTMHSSEDKLNLILTLILIVAMLITWQKTPALLNKIDQLNNDLGEQRQVIEMEKKNNSILDKIETSQDDLKIKRETVLDAVPYHDEKAEQVISTLETIVRDQQIEPISSISIRQVPQTQIGYEDLSGVADVYEYAFTVESALPPILNILREIRKSPRLMDIIAFEIQENKGLYRASFSLYAYNLIKS